MKNRSSVVALSLFFGFAANATTAMEDALTVFRANTVCVEAYGAHTKAARAKAVNLTGSEFYPQYLLIEIGPWSTSNNPNPKLRVFITKNVPTKEIFHDEVELLRRYINAVITMSIPPDQYRLGNKSGFRHVIAAAKQIADGDPVTQVQGGVVIDTSKLSEEKFKEFIANLLKAEERLRERLAF